MGRTHIVWARTHAHTHTHTHTHTALPTLVHYQNWKGPKDLGEPEKVFVPKLLGGVSYAHCTYFPFHTYHTRTHACKHTHTHKNKNLSKIRARITEANEMSLYVGESK